MQTLVTVDFPTIPDSEFDDRLAAFRSKMAAAELDLAVVFSNLLDPGHVRYLSDVSPINESAAIVIPLEGEAILCTGQACQAWSEFKSRIKSIRILPEVGEVAGTEYEIGEQFTCADLFREMKNKYRIRKIGTVGRLVFPQIVYSQLAKVFHDAEIVNAEPLIFELRKIKSSNEIECMRKASRILDDAFADVVKKIEVGWSELDIHAEIQANVLRAGSESAAVAWEPMIASGPNSQLCMNRSSRRQVQEGEIICLQAGCVYEGMNAAICTPLVLGAIPDCIRNAVSVGNEAKEAVLGSLKPGVTTKQLNSIGRGIFERAGFGANSPYGIVHMIGWNECESPWLPADKDFVMEEGMTICLDVFLFRLPWGSFRIEDTVAVGKNGADRLTTFNDRFIARYFDVH